MRPVCLHESNEVICMACHRYECARLEDKAAQLGIAFDDQSRELTTAVALLEELGAEHALEYRRRAYPTLYPRP